jgi:hypothetical protein
MNLVHRVFFGPAELRAGWRLVIFVVIFIAATLVMLILSRPLGGHLNSEEIKSIVRSIGTLVPLLVAGALMAKIERRKMADYGLPWRRLFGKQFWQGALIGFRRSRPWLPRCIWLGRSRSPKGRRRGL